MNNQTKSNVHEGNWRQWKTALESLIQDDKTIHAAWKANHWFSPCFIKLSIQNLLAWFEEDPTQFLSNYKLTEKKKNVGIIMAGNLPLVGFHDLLMGWLSGHELHVKLSSKDKILTEKLLDVLGSKISKQIHLVDDFGKSNPDLLIFTGSDNTSRYILHQFENTEKLIRKNRYSIAILEGDESESELQLLAEDILLYNGLGCRNVSNILVPENYDFSLLVSVLDRYPNQNLSGAYLEALHWKQAEMEMTSELFKKSKHLLLTKKPTLIHAEIGCLNAVTYQSQTDISRMISEKQNELQCVVGRNQKVSFGESQKPGLTDFADGVDTLEFLCKQIGSEKK